MELSVNKLEVFELCRLAAEIPSVQTGIKLACDIFCFNLYLFYFLTYTILVYFTI